MALSAKFVPCPTCECGISARVESLSIRAVVRCYRWTLGGGDRRRILPCPTVGRFLRRCLPSRTLCEGGNLLGPQFERLPELGRALHDEGAVETGQQARRPLQAPGRTPQKRPSFRLLQGEPHRWELSSHLLHPGLQQHLYRPPVAR